MPYWLVKSEPDSFGWDQQVARGVEPWTGVRNHSAKNNLLAMRVGDLAFFYHSNVGKQIVGVVEVAREAYPDPTDAAWIAVDVRTVGPMPTPVPLAAIKADLTPVGVAGVGRALGPPLRTGGLARATHRRYREENTSLGSDYQCPIPRFT